MRDRITFKCAVCGEENYIGTRNKRKHPERMTIAKYCPRCNKKTEHKEKGSGNVEDRSIYAWPDDRGQLLSGQ